MCYSGEEETDLECQALCFLSYCSVPGTFSVVSADVALYAIIMQIHGHVLGLCNNGHYIVSILHHACIVQRHKFGPQIF